MPRSASANSVTTVSTHIVHCANETSSTKLKSPFPLGPFDYRVAPFIPIPVVFVYRQQPSSGLDIELLPVERLRHSLTLLLDHYPHLTGRLNINASNGTTEVVRLGTGAEFVVAQCSEPLDAFASTEPDSLGRILMQNLPDCGNALFPPYSFTPEATCSGPLFSMQHTRFACGSVALGVRLRHIICDADGFFQLVRHLTEIYRQVQPSGANKDTYTPSAVQIGHPPHISSYLSELNGENLTPEERAVALNYKPDMMYVDPEEEGTDIRENAFASKVPSSYVPPPVTGRFIRFSSSELKALKAHATGPSEKSSGWISTFDALCAHLYQSVYRARVQLRLRVNDPAVPPMSPPDFLTPVNLRSHLPPETIPSLAQYFPNALFVAYTSLPPDLLSDGPLSQIAQSIHSITRVPALTSSSDVLKTLKWLAAQPDQSKVKIGFRPGDGSLMLSQWNKFDVFGGAVFDGDLAPALVSSPFTPISSIDGLGYFFPTPEADDQGGIDVNLALSEPVWDILDQDVEFRKFRST